MNGSQLIKTIGVAILAVTLVVTQLGLYSVHTASQTPLTPISAPKYSGSLDGQVWVQVVGNNSAAIPILQQAHATTALYYTGANELTSQNIGYWREIWQQDHASGLMVAFEWWFAGGWGRTMDSNYQVYEYVQAHPNQSWAEFVDTFINSSSPPKGTQVLANGSMIVPLELGDQYYVYEWWSPANFSWMYNETHYALAGHCVSVVQWYSTSCLSTESSGKYRVGYGSYSIFYNSTGLFLRFYSYRSPKVVYNLHWISFLTATTGKEYICPPGETNECKIIQGEVQWPSLFYPGSFDVWVNSWLDFARNVSGYINYTTSDNGGFPSYDANPGLLQYLEREYHFAFTFDNWTYSPAGGQTESEFLYHYENYLLMSRLAEIKQEIAHEYGFGVVIDGSDQNTGIYNEMGYVDGFTCWNCDEEIFGSWAGTSWFSNTSAAFGFEDWYGSMPTASEIQAAASNFLFNAQLLRPEGSFIVWAWQFPTTELAGTEVLATAAKYDMIFEQADGYARFVSDIGAQRYTVGTVYVNNSQIFYQMPVWMTPGQINEVHLGEQWFSILRVNGSVSNVGVYPQLTISKINPRNFFGGYIMYPGSSGGTYWYQMYEEVFPQLIHIYFPNTTSFWVYDVFNTYVFNYSRDYYVLFDNFVGQSRSVPFIYHNLAGYIAINLQNDQLITNTTNLTLAPYSLDMIFLEPQGQYPPSLIYTNATRFSASNGTISLTNPIASTTVVTIQSDLPISGFVLNISGDGTLIIPGYNTTNVHVTFSGGEYYYMLTLPYIQRAQLTAESGSSITQNTTTLSSSTSSASSSSTSSASSSSTSSASSSSTSSASSSSTSSASSSSTSSASSSSSVSTPLQSGGSSAISAPSSSGEAGTQSSSTPSNYGDSSQSVFSYVTQPLSTISSSLLAHRVQILVGVSLLGLIVFVGVYSLRVRSQISK